MNAIINTLTYNGNALMDASYSMNEKPITGDMGNYSSILTRLIHEAGRFCIRWASDLFIHWNAAVETLSGTGEGSSADVPDNICFVFGFREDGVDNAGTVADNLQAGMRYYYRSIYCMEAVRERGSWKLVLRRADSLRRHADAKERVPDNSLRGFIISESVRRGAVPGDAFSVEIPGFGNLEARAAAFEADRIAGTGRKAAVTMVMNLKTRHCMDQPDGAGGWERSEMRRWLDMEVLPQFPDWLREAVVPVEKTSWTRMQNGSMQDVVTSDRLWIPSMREIYSDRSWAEKRGPVYESLFENDGCRALLDKDGDPMWWWLRSTNSCIDPSFEAVDGDGSYCSIRATSREGGVVVGFCLDL